MAKIAKRSQRKARHLSLEASLIATLRTLLDNSVLRLSLPVLSAVSSLAMKSSTISTRFGSDDLSAACCVFWLRWRSILLIIRPEPSKMFALWSISRRRELCSHFHISANGLLPESSCMRRY